MMTGVTLLVILGYTKVKIPCIIMRETVDVKLQFGDMMWLLFLYTKIPLSWLINKINIHISMCKIS